MKVNINKLIIFLLLTLRKEKVEEENSRAWKKRYLKENLYHTRHDIQQSKAE